MTGEDGYEGVTHAGVALVSLRTGEVLLAQRSFDPTDAPDVAETWEFPGGGLDEGEDAQAGAFREFTEEVGLAMPADAEVVDGWRSDDGVYQGFVVTTQAGFVEAEWNPTDEVQAVAWVAQADLPKYTLRPEVEMQTDWSLIFGPVSGNEEESMDEAAQYGAIPVMPIPVHGVVAPEEAPTGDARGFAKGSMTKRPLRLPFRDTTADVGAHGGAFVVGSVDRLMRADGLVQWEGLLMPAEQTDGIVGKMQFFDGRYGVSVDGDQGKIDSKRTAADEVLWFDQIRAAGLTAVDIPAFHEAYVAFGFHPSMPSEDTLVAAAYESGDLLGGRRAFDRGPGWITDPKATKNIHDYWTKKGEEGYAKIAWGTPGDFTRAKNLIGAKIAEHSPGKMKYLNQIIAQWHHDALGYWPGDLGKPGNAPDTPENRARAARHAKKAGVVPATFSIDRLSEDDPIRGEAYCIAAECSEPGEFSVSSDDPEWFGIYCEAHAAEAEGKPLFSEDHTALVEQVAEIRDDIEVVTDDDVSEWEAVLVSSATGKRALPPLSYFHEYTGDDGAINIHEPDALGFRRVTGFAAEWGVCHIGMNGVCVEPPETGSDDYPGFHKGRTKTDAGYVYTGVLTYGVGHRDAKTILRESADEAFFDNLKNAWAAVRVGENDRGIWFSGVVLPTVPEDDIVAIEASGQVSGEWLHDEMRACLTVNVRGFEVERPSVEYDADGNVMALAASAFNRTSPNGGDCPPTPQERFAAMRQIDAEIRFAALRAEFLAERAGA